MLQSIAPVRQETSALPAGYVEVPCAVCSTVIAVPRRLSTCPTCDSCLRDFGNDEAHRTVRLVESLVRGTYPFGKMNGHERQSFLRRIAPSLAALPNDADRMPSPVDDEPIYTWDGEAPDPATRDEIESRIELDPFDEAFGA